MDLGRPPEARYLGEPGGQYLRNNEVKLIMVFVSLICCVFVCLNLDSCNHENTSLGIYGRVRGCSRAGW